MSRKTLALAVGFALRWAIFMVLSIPPLCLIWYPLMWAFYALSYKQDSDRSSIQQKFSKHDPFFRYGHLIAEQNITFYSLAPNDTAKELETKVHHLVYSVVRQIPHLTPRLTEPDIRSATMTDVGIKTKPHAKTFVEYSAETHFNTRVSIIFGVTAVYNTVSVRWWVLTRGPIDQWSAIRTGLVAPFTVLYWGLKQMQGVHSIKAALAAELEHEFDRLDIEAWLGVFQKHVLRDLTKQMQIIGFETDINRQKAGNLISHFDEDPALEIASLTGSDAGVDAVESPRQTREHIVIESPDVPVSSLETFDVYPAIEALALDDTVEIPLIQVEPTAEIEEVIPAHLSELHQMLRYHIEGQHGQPRHEAKAVASELIVELKTGDEISIKILTALLEELRMVLGDVALRDTLEMLTDPTGSFNDIVQEITGDLLANLGDEMALKAKKQELSQVLTEQANLLDSHKRPPARLAIFGLMHILDNADSKNYDGIFKEIRQCLGHEAYEIMLQTVEADENHFPATAQVQARHMLNIHLKKCTLRDGLLNRTTSLEPLKKEKAIDAIDKLITALEDPNIADYKAIFREVGLRLGRPAYESLLRKLAADGSDFPLAQSQAKRDLDLFEQAQQRSVN